MDHYEVLGVTPEATMEEIRRAYLAAARRFHPDRHGGDRATQQAAESRMQDINRSWEILSDRARRAEHDDRRAAAARPGAAPWQPYDGSAASGFDADHDRPLSRGGIPGWLRIAPTAAFVGGLAGVMVGGVLDLSGLVGIGLLAVSISLMLFVAAALVALTSSRR